MDPLTIAASPLRKPRDDAADELPHKPHAAAAVAAPRKPRTRRAPPPKTMGGVLSLREAGVGALAWLGNDVMALVAPRLLMSDIDTLYAILEHFPREVCDSQQLWDGFELAQLKAMEPMQAIKWVFTATLLTCKPVFRRRIADEIKSIAEPDKCWKDGMINGRSAQHIMMIMLNGSLDADCVPVVRNRQLIESQANAVLAVLKRTSLKHIPKQSQTYCAVAFLHYRDVAEFDSFPACDNNMFFSSLYREAVAVSAEKAVAIRDYVIRGAVETRLDGLLCAAWQLNRDDDVIALIQKMRPAARVQLGFWMAGAKIDDARFAKLYPHAQMEMADRLVLVRREEAKGDRFKLIDADVVSWTRSDVIGFRPEHIVDLIRLYGHKLAPDPAGAALIWAETMPTTRMSPESYAVLSANETMRAARDLAAIALNTDRAEEMAPLLVRDGLVVIADLIIALINHDAERFENYGATRPDYKPRAAHYIDHLEFTEANVCRFIKFAVDSFEQSSRVYQWRYTQGLGAVLARIRDAKIASREIVDQCAELLRNAAGPYALLFSIYSAPMKVDA
jgi:hypothetical protein